MKQVLNLLKELNYSLSACESLTGGLFSKTITDFPGVSQVFKGSIISYANEAKINVANIKVQIINKYGAISPECALAMAQAVRKKFKTDMAIAFTGNAGPLPSEDKPVGLVYIAIVSGKFFLIEELQLHGTRSEIRKEVVSQAQKLLVKNLTKIKKETLK